MNSLSAAPHRGHGLVLGVVIVTMCLVAGCEELDLAESGDQLDTTSRPAALAAVAPHAASAATANALSMSLRFLSAQAGERSRERTIDGCAGYNLKRHPRALNPDPIASFSTIIKPNP